MSPGRPSRVLVGLAAFSCLACGEREPGADAGGSVDGHPPSDVSSGIGATHDDYLRVADCAECPAGYAFCRDHFRTPLFCTNERPHAWFCRELAE